MKLRSLPLLAAAILVAAIFLPLPEGGKIAGLPSICPFFNITGLPCPACGLTRSFVCLGHGRIAEAFAWHPLGPLLFAATLFYLVFSLLKPDFQLEKRLQNRISFSSAAIFLLFWGLRLGHVFPLP